jgi:hypothetical protein
MTPLRQRREQVRAGRRHLRLPVLFRPFSLRRVKGFVSASKTVRELCLIISGVPSSAFFAESDHER